MSLQDYKITDEAISQKGIVSSPDKLTGKAEDNKKLFDRLVRETVKTLFNALIDELASKLGASGIGALKIIEEGEETVQGQLSALAAHVKSLAKSSDVETLLKLKTDTDVSNKHFKNVSFDSLTGIFEFERESGEKVSFDTAIEKIAINFEYDADTESLVLHLADGSVQKIPMSSLISETEFVSSPYIDFVVDGKCVSANIKAESITDENLSSSLKEQLLLYVGNAAESASLADGSAAESAESARVSADFAASSEESAASAESSKKSAELASGNAVICSGSAQESAVSAQESAGRAESAAVLAERAAERAETAVLGDPSAYVKKTDVAVVGGEAGLIKVAPTSEGNGVNIREGCLSLIGATGAIVEAKSSNRQAVTPKTVDNAIRAGITSNALDLTQAQKEVACSWLGALGLDSVGCIPDAVVGYDHTLSHQNISGDGKGHYKYLHEGDIDALNIPEIEIISYTGTGGYGETNAVEVTCSFAPQLLVLLGYYDLTKTNNIDAYKHNFIPCDYLTEEWKSGLGFAVQVDSSTVHAKKSADGKTISYYGQNTTEMCNTMGHIYYLLAIGG